MAARSATTAPARAPSATGSPSAPRLSARCRPSTRRRRASSSSARPSSSSTPRSSTTAWSAASPAITVGMRLRGPWHARRRHDRRFHRDADRGRRRRAGFKIRGIVANLDTTAKTFTIGNALISYASVTTVPADLANGLLLRCGCKPSRSQARGWRPVSARRARSTRTPTRPTSKARSPPSPRPTQFSVNGIAVDASKATFPNGTRGRRLGAQVEVQGTSSNGVVIAKRVSVETHARRPCRRLRAARRHHRDRHDGPDLRPARRHRELRRGQRRLPQRHGGAARGRRAARGARHALRRRHDAASRRASRSATDHEPFLARTGPLAVGPRRPGRAMVAPWPP